MKNKLKCDYKQKIKSGYTKEDVLQKIKKIVYHKWGRQPFGLFYFVIFLIIYFGFQEYFFNAVKIVFLNYLNVIYYLWGILNVPFN